MISPETFAKAFKSETFGDDCVITISCELDVFTSPLLEKALETVYGCKRIVVDLTDCRYLAASALSVLLRAQNRTDGALSLIVTPGIVERVLKITKLYDKLRAFSLDMDSSSHRQITCHREPGPLRDAAPQYRR